MTTATNYDHVNCPYADCERIGEHLHTTRRLEGEGPHYLHHVPPATPKPEPEPTPRTLPSDRWTPRAEALPLLEDGKFYQACLMGIPLDSPRWGKTVKEDASFTHVAALPKLAPPPIRRRPEDTPGVPVRIAEAELTAGVDGYRFGVPKSRHWWTTDRTSISTHVVYIAPEEA